MIDVIDAIFYSAIFGAAVYKIGNFFMTFLIAVRAHYWG